LVGWLVGRSVGPNTEGDDALSRCLDTEQIEHSQAHSTLTQLSSSKGSFTRRDSKYPSVTEIYRNCKLNRWVCLCSI